VNNIQHLIQYIQQAACGESNYDCALRVSDLKSADTVDMNYDSISNAFTISALWSKSPLGDEKWWETHLLPSQGHSTEIGALTNETPEEPEELRYSGFLTKIGEDAQPCRSKPITSQSKSKDLTDEQHLSSSQFHLVTTHFPAQAHSPRHLSNQRVSTQPSS
jgi:hypothetical protein